MISLTNRCRLVAIAAMPRNAPSGLSKNTLWQVSPKLTLPLHLWDLLRTSILHPQLSTAAHFHGLLDYNKTYFAPPGWKIIAHEKPGKRRTWAPHGKHGYSLVPAMHHYRCQNVYISATASERIVYTLEYCPHNYQMPKVSSTDRLLMAAKDMAVALHNPHLEVPFTRVRDATISALADLAAIFKLKLRQTPSPTPQAVPPTIFQRPCLDESSYQILNSSMPVSRRTRSQTTIQTQDISNAPLPPRVVTPRTLCPSPPRLPTRLQRLYPRNLSQDDFCGMDTPHMAIALGDNHWSRQHQANALIHPLT
jgi:hypothetical protein